MRCSCLRAELMVGRNTLAEQASSDCERTQCNISQVSNRKEKVETPRGKTISLQEIIQKNTFTTSGLRRIF